MNFSPSWREPEQLLTLLLSLHLWLPVIISIKTLADLLRPQDKHCPQWKGQFCRMKETHYPWRCDGTKWIDTEGPELAQAPWTPEPVGSQEPVGETGRALQGSQAPDQSC